MAVGGFGRNRSGHNRRFSGELLAGTPIREKIPIKIAVFNNGVLGFVDLEMKCEGLLDVYTNLDNPDFAHVVRAISFHPQRVEHAADLEDAVKDWITPGTGLARRGYRSNGARHATED